MQQDGGAAAAAEAGGGQGADGGDLPAGQPVRQRHVIPLR